MGECDVTDGQLLESTDNIHQNHNPFIHETRSSGTRITMCSNRISSHLEGSILGSAVKSVYRQYYGLQNFSQHLKNKAIQTDYRENDCQTLPWEPPYEIAPEQNPEVLMLTNFTWGQGLPAGVHEMEVINRMRMRRAWEKISPPMDTPANIKTRSALTTDLENDNWAFRESEIQHIMDLRMNLDGKIRQLKDYEKQKITEDRFKILDEELSKRKQREISNIKNKYSRELRRLNVKRETIKARQDKCNIIKFHTNRNLDFCNPKLRYRSSQASPKKNYFEEECVNIDELENEAILSDWLSSASKQNYSASKPYMPICPRVSRRNEKKLLELDRHLESIKINDQYANTCSLLKLRQKMPPSEGIEDKVEMSSNLLQEVVNECDMQGLILEEENYYGESIEEIRAAEVLENSEDLSSEKMHLTLQQFDEEYETLQEISEDSEGKSIAKARISVNKESTTLRNEKEAYTLLFLSEKNSQSSEEQLDTNRSEESDEKYVIVMVDKTSATAKHVEKTAEDVNVEEIVTDLIYNFVLPKVENELSDIQKICLCTPRSFTSNRFTEEILNTSEDRLLSNDASSDYSDASSDRSSSSTKISTPSGLENYVIHETKTCDEIYSSSNAFNDKDSLKPIIDLIMDYAIILDGKKDKQDVYNILEQMLWDARERVSDFQLNKSSSSRLCICSFLSSCTSSTSDT